MTAAALMVAACGGVSPAPTRGAVTGTQAARTPSATPEAHPATTVVHTTGGCVNVPILVYHYIRLVTSTANELGYSLSVSPTEFATQMDWLKLSGGHTVTLARVLQAMNGGPPLPPHAVVLTFDDGYDDFATAATPVLQRDGFIGTDFVVSGFIGRHGYMTAQQVQQVAADGMVIGAHTVHHVDLASLPASLQAIEITASKETLQRLLHTPVTDFAYPYGDVGAATAALVAHAGFSDAVTMTAGTHQCAGGRYLLPRIRVEGSDTVWSFSRSAGIAPPPKGWSDPLYAAHRRP